MFSLEDLASNQIGIKVRIVRKFDSIDFGNLKIATQQIPDFFGTISPPKFQDNPALMESVVLKFLPAALFLGRQMDFLQMTETTGIVCQ